MKAIDKELPEVKEAYEMSKEDDESPQKRYLVYDEMWHFLERKENKLWIIKLYDTVNNKLVDFILGNRDENTFLTIYKRNKNRANSTYYIDNWTTFETVLKANNERYVIGKENTYPIEQHNSNTRHYLGRFIRRTKNVSRSEQMVAISIKLMTLPPRGSIPYAYFPPCRDRRQGEAIRRHVPLSDIFLPHFSNIGINEQINA